MPGRFFLLNKRDGMKYKEIAELFGISVHTVDNHITKATPADPGGCEKNLYLSV